MIYKYFSTRCRYYYQYLISPTGVSNKAPWCLYDLFSNSNQTSYCPPLIYFDTGTKYGHVLFNNLIYFPKTFSSDSIVSINTFSVHLLTYFKYLYCQTPRDTLSDIPRRYQVVYSDLWYQCVAFMKQRVCVRDGFGYYLQ